MIIHPRKMPGVALYADIMIHIFEEAEKRYLKVMDRLKVSPIATPLPPFLKTRTMMDVKLHPNGDVVPYIRCFNTITAPLEKAKVPGSLFVEYGGKLATTDNPTNDKTIPSIMTPSDTFEVPGGLTAQSDDGYFAFLPQSRGWYPVTHSIYSERSKYKPGFVAMVPVGA
jgi:hypothetical protein